MAVPGFRAWVEREPTAERLEEEAAELLGIPEHMTQCALLPVAYTKGTDFKPAARPPVSEITYLDTYKNPIQG